MENTNVRKLLVLFLLAIIIEKKNRRPTHQSIVVLFWLSLSAIELNVGDSDLNIQYPTTDITNIIWLPQFFVLSHHYFTFITLTELARSASSGFISIYRQFYEICGIVAYLSHWPGGEFFNFIANWQLFSIC